MGRSGGAVAAFDVLALDRGGAHLPARLTAATATPHRAWPDAVSAAVFQQALADLTAAYRNIFASVAGRRKTPRPAGPGSGPARTAGRPSGSPPTPVRVLTSGKLRLPKIGDVPVRWSRPPPAGLGPGFGGSVDVETIDPWNVPGRYGWVGGIGTAAHITASTGTITILLSQLQMAGPTPPALVRDFWQHAANA